MKTLALLLSLVCLSLPAIAADDPTAHHRAVYEAINKAQPKLRLAKATIKEGEEMSWAIQGWFEGDTLRKIVAAVPGEDGAGSEEFYFEGDALVFAFRQYASAAEDGKKSQQQEDRFYFTKNKLIRWLGPDKAPVPGDSPEFEMEGRVLVNKSARFGAALLIGTVTLAPEEDPDKPKAKVKGVQTAEGYFTGVELGDYFHWNMITMQGVELSFFVLKPEASVDKMLDEPTDYLRRKCRITWKTSTEDIPESGGKMEVEQVLSVEWLKK